MVGDEDWCVSIVIVVVDDAATVVDRTVVDADVSTKTIQQRNTFRNAP